MLFIDKFTDVYKFNFFSIVLYKLPQMLLSGLVNVSVDCTAAYYGGPKRPFEVRIRQHQAFHISPEKKVKIDKSKQTAI